MGLRFKGRFFRAAGLALLVGVPLSWGLAALVAHLELRSQEASFHQLATQFSDTLDARLGKYDLAVNAVAGVSRVRAGLSESEWLRFTRLAWPDGIPAGARLLRLRAPSAASRDRADAGFGPCVVDAGWPRQTFSRLSGSDRCQAQSWSHLLRKAHESGRIELADLSAGALAPRSSRQTVFMARWVAPRRHWVLLALPATHVFDGVDSVRGKLAWRVVDASGADGTTPSVLYTSAGLPEPGEFSRAVGVARRYRLDESLSDGHWVLEARGWANAAPWPYLAFAAGLLASLAGVWIGFMVKMRRRAALELAEDMTRKLRRSHDLLASVADNIHDGIYRGTPDGRLVYVSKRLAHMFAFPDEGAMLSCDSRSLYVDPAQRDAVRRRLLEQGQYDNVETEFRRVDGTRFTGLDTSRLVREDDGTPAYYVGAVADISARRVAERQAEFVAKYDQLTGLANRHLFEARAEQLLPAGGTEARGLILLDLDRFKQTNDLHGRDVADMALLEVASRLRRALQPEDMIARLEADEFAVLMRDVAAPEDVASLAGELQDLVREPLEMMGAQLRLTASVGAAVYPDDGGDIASLLASAETALKRAKGSGRDRLVFFEPALTRAALRSLQLEDALHKALDSDELALYYQPRVSLRTGSVSGAEALARWQSAVHGAVGPDEFIPIAERSGLIERLGLWVLGSALEEWKVWSTMLDLPPTVGVNASAKQLHGRTYSDSVLTLMKKLKVPNHGLEIELTESQLLDLGLNQEEALFALKESAIRVALDDFGTGYSNLAYLVRLRIDVVKIDRSFVSRILEDANVASLVRGIIGLARDFGARVVAEGVETAEQLRVLSELGCDEIQGYLLAKPMPAVDFRDFLRRVDAEGLPTPFREVVLEQ